MYPTYAVYPQLIPQVQLFDALHRGKEAIMQKKRLKFFWIVFVVIFVWEWFPVCILYLEKVLLYNFLSFFKEYIAPYVTSWSPRFALRY